VRFYFLDIEMVKNVNFTEKIPISHHLIEIRDRLVLVGIVVGLFFGLMVDHYYQSTGSLF